jgi:integrase
LPAPGAIAEPIEHACDTAIRQRPRQLARNVDDGSIRAVQWRCCPARFRETKTGEAREVDLTPRVVAAFSAFQAELEAEALVDGESGILPVGLRDACRNAAAAASLHEDFQEGAEGRRASALPALASRHTYASHLIAQRADSAYVARQLGHAKMTTTLLF